MSRGPIPRINKIITVGKSHWDWQSVGWNHHKRQALKAWIGHPLCQPTKVTFKTRTECYQRNSKLLGRLIFPLQNPVLQFHIQTKKWAQTAIVLVSRSGDSVHIQNSRNLQGPRFVSAVQNSHRSDFAKTRWIRWIPCKFTCIWLDMCGKLSYAVHLPGPNSLFFHLRQISASPVAVLPRRNMNRRPTALGTILLLSSWKLDAIPTATYSA